MFIGTLFLLGQRFGGECSFDELHCVCVGLSMSVIDCGITEKKEGSHLFLIHMFMVDQQQKKLTLKQLQ